VSEQGQSEDRIAQIRAREQAATKGPWTAYEMTHYGDSGTGFWSVQPIGEPDDTMTESDAAFIANARVDIPYLLDRLSALEETLRQIQEKADSWEYPGQIVVDEIRELAARALSHE
jgi:hypothetical protein